MREAETWMSADRCRRPDLRCERLYDRSRRAEVHKSSRRWRPDALFLGSICINYAARPEMPGTSLLCVPALSVTSYPGRPGMQAATNPDACNPDSCDASPDTGSQVPLPAKANKESPVHTRIDVISQSEFAIDNLYLLIPKLLSLQLPLNHAQQLFATGSVCGGGNDKIGKVFEDS